MFDGEAVKQGQIWWMAIAVWAVAACSGEQTSSDAPGAQGEVAAAPPSGKEIYDNYCFSCHNVGLSGAPRLGDVEAWAPRIAKGNDLLLQTTIDGIAPARPARGMCFDCSDEDLAAAVEYMVVESQ